MQRWHIAFEEEIVDAGADYAKTSEADENADLDEMDDSEVNLANAPENLSHRNFDYSLLRLLNVVNYYVHNMAWIYIPKI